MTERAPAGTGNAGLAVRNSAFSLLSLGARLVGNLVVFLVIARLPGVDVAAFGQLTYAVALASLCVMISQFGLVSLLIRDVAADRALLGAHVNAILGLRMLLSVLGLTGLAFFVNAIDLSPQARTVCYLIAAAMYVGAFSVDLQAVFQSQERMHLELVGVVVENGLLLALALAAFFFDAGVVEVALIFLVAKSVALVLNYAICARRLVVPSLRFDRDLWGRLLGEALPFALTGLLAAGIVQLDTLLLRELAAVGDDAVGLYQAAVRLFLVPMLLPEIVVKVLLPQFSRMHGRDGSGLVRDLGRVNHVLLTLGLLVSLVTVFRAEDLVRLIYGDRYAGAGAVLQVLGLSIIMRFGAAYNLYFTLRNRIWFRVASALLALVAVVGFDMLLIPRHGALGAAYASVLAHVVYWIPYLVAIYAAERTMRLGWMPVRAFAVAAVLAAFLYASAGLNLLVMLPIYAAACALGALLAMAPGDRRTIVSQLGARFAR